MKKLTIGVLCVLMTIGLAGCSTNQKAATTSPSPTGAATNKVGTTNKTGTISKAGNVFVLQSAGESLTIDSYDLDLGKYVGQKVSVSGQFSGDTLFVTKVE